MVEPTVVEAVVAETVVVELPDSVSNAIVGDGANVGDGAADEASSCLANKATRPRAETALKAREAAFAPRAGFTRRPTGALRGGNDGGDGGGKLTLTVC